MNWKLSTLTMLAGLLAFGAVFMRQWLVGWVDATTLLGALVVVAVVGVVFVGAAVGLAPWFRLPELDLRRWRRKQGHR